MSERMPVWGELPPDGTVLTTAEYLQTAGSLRVQELIYGTLPHPQIGKLDDRIRNFSHYGVRECWLVHQLSREIEVLGFAGGGERRMFRGVQRIESKVLPDFGLSPEVLSCW